MPLFTSLAFGGLEMASRLHALTPASRAMWGGRFLLARGGGISLLVAASFDLCELEEDVLSFLMA